MGWHMKLVLCVQLAYVSVCLTQLSVVREWTSWDVQLTSEDGQESRRSIKAYEIESWLMYKDRMFVTFNGEWEYYLAYLDLTDNSTSPLLRLYPSWEARMVIGYRRILIFNPYKVRVDRCDRLWLMSVTTETDDIVLVKYYYKMTVFDLKTDSILRNIFFPNLTYFLDMTVDDFDCDNEYVYISDYDGVWTYSWTYSWAEGDSWRHNTSIFARITSMILVPNSIVYYNLAYYESKMNYIISTIHLRDKSNKTIDILGRSRKLNVDLASSALDAKSDILYYFNHGNSTVIHAVPCWTSERCSTNCQDDIDVGFDSTHIVLRYITVDKNGYLWAVTSESSFDGGIIKFRLLSVPVKSTCIESNAKDTTNTTTGVESNAKDTTNTSTGVESNAKDTTNTNTGVESNTKDTTNTSITDVKSNAKDTTNTSTGVESNTKDTTNTSTGVESNTKDTTNTSITDVKSNAKDTTNTSTGVESNTKDTTNTSTGVESNAKDTTNTTNINESTTAPSSATDGRTISQILPLLIFLITILTKA